MDVFGSDFQYYPNSTLSEISDKNPTYLSGTALGVPQTMGKTSLKTRNETKTRKPNHAGA
jgi:hypothetical protein